MSALIHVLSDSADEVVGPLTRTTSARFLLATPVLCCVAAATVTGVAQVGFITHAQAAVGERHR